MSKNKYIAEEKYQIIKAISMELIQFSVSSQLEIEE